MTKTNGLVKYIILSTNSTAKVKLKYQSITNNNNIMSIKIRRAFIEKFWTKLVNTYVHASPNCLSIM